MINKTKDLFNNIQECEFDKEKCLKKVENLNSQIYMYIRNDSLNLNLIENYKKQLEFKEEIIKFMEIIGKDEVEEIFKKCVFD